MTVELRIRPSDAGQFEDLREWMRGNHGVTVRAVARAPEPNSQGTVWDFLSVGCAAGGPIVAAVRALQLWMEARVTVVEIEVGDRRIKVTTPTAAAVLPQVIDAAKALESELKEPDPETSEAAPGTPERPGPPTAPGTPGPPAPPEGPEAPDEPA